MTSSLTDGPPVVSPALRKFTKHSPLRQWGPTSPLLPRHGLRAPPAPAAITLPWRTPLILVGPSSPASQQLATQRSVHPGYWSDSQTLHPRSASQAAQSHLQQLPSTTSTPTTTTLYYNFTSRHLPLNRPVNSAAPSSSTAASARH